MDSKPEQKPPIRAAVVVAELTLEGVAKINGVTYDGRYVWIADGTGGGLAAVDPRAGVVVRRLPDVAAPAGTAFDGAHLYQIAGELIHKIDPATGATVATLPVPGGAPASGLGSADGALWVGQGKLQRIVKIDAVTGEVLKTITSDRFVTGVTWVDEELWHGTLGESAEELRRVDPSSGEVLERILLPEGIHPSGLEADDEGRLWFGDWANGKLRAVARRA